MTNKKEMSLPSIEELRSVTNKLNDVEVEIPHMVFTYRSYYALPDFITDEERKDNLANIIENLALLYKQGLLFLMSGKYERYLAYLIEKEYSEMVEPQSNVIKSVFKILKYNKLAYKVHKKDILYVYDSNEILIVTDDRLSKKFRAIRGN